MKNYLLYTLLIFAEKIFAQTVYLDTISFEAGQHNITIDTQANNLWQVGKPTKSQFISAHSFPNAIVTDTIHAYSSNNFSSFTFPVVFDGINMLSFWHKIDTDAGHAGGFIEDSIAGFPWKNIVQGPILSKNCEYESFPINFYDSTQTITGNIPAFTGNSGWVYSEYQWICFCRGPRQSLWPDTVWFRFNFLSDSLNTTKDGWMIDDIRFQADICSGTNPLDRLSLSIYPNPAHDEITISASEAITDGKVNIFSLTGELILSESFHGPHITIREKLVSGIYFVQVTCKEGILVKKIFIE